MNPVGPPDDSSDCLLDLIAKEFALRRAMGERPEVEEYVHRHPQIAAQLRQRLLALNPPSDTATIAAPRDQAPAPLGEASDAHPASDELAAFAQGRLRGDAHATVEKHVAGCADCCRLLGQVSEDSLLRRFRLLAAPSETSTPEAVPVVPGYEILEQVGRGGMGVVWKARHSILARIVALKMIRAGLQADPQDLERLRGEAQASARLQHPNIVQIFEVGESAGQPFLALEFLPGGSLADRYRGQPQSPREAAALAQTLARAVSAAHDAGVIHRDLKPANILLTADGVPKICDFGLAKRVADESSLTQTGAVMGTPSYMSPEQAEGKTVAPASDVWAMGAILYELLTGRPPFKGTGLLDTLDQVRSGNPVPVRQLQPQCPRDLETICLKCLSKEPSRRYASAGDLADDLARFLSGRPVLARPVGAWERAAKVARRHPIVASLITVLLLGGISALVLVTWFWLRAESAGEAARSMAREEEKAKKAAQDAQRQAMQRRQEALEAADQAERSGYLRGINLADARWLAGDLQGAQQVLNECPVRLRDWEWRQLEARCAEADYTILTHELSLPECVAFQPNGRLLAFGSGEYVGCWDSFERRERFRLRLGKDQAISSVSFSPDGRWLAAATRAAGGSSAAGGEVRLLDAETGREIRTMTGHTIAVFSPDGNTLATVGPSSTVLLLDARTGDTLHRLVGHKTRISNVAFKQGGDLLVTSDVARFVKLWWVRPGGAPAATASLVGTAMTPFPGPWLGLADWTARGSSPVSLMATMNAAQATLGTVPSFSPDGRRFAIAGRDQEVHVLDGTAGREVLSFPAECGRLTSAVYSPDGKQLASAGWNGVIRLWQSDTARPLQVLRGSGGAIRGVTFHPDGEAIASFGFDRTIRVWDPRREPGTRSAGSHKQTVVSLTFTPNSDRLVSVDEAGVVQLSNVAGGTSHALATPFGGQAFYRVVCFPSGELIAVGGLNGIVRLLEIPSGRVTRTLDGNGDSVFSMASSRDGRLLACGFASGKVKIWRISQNTVEGIWESQPNRFPVASVAFTLDDEFLVTGRSDGVVESWSAENGTKGKSFTVRCSISSISFSPDGRLLAIGGADPIVGRGELQLWDWRSLRLVRTLPAHGGIVQHLAFSPNGNRLASAEALGDNVVRLWDTTSGEALLTLRGHSGSVFALAFSPDGRWLASGGAGGAIKLWKGPPDRRITTIRAGAGPFIGLALHPSADRLVTAGLDRSVIVWDARTGRQVIILTPNSSLTTAVAYHGGGDGIATVGLDGNLRLWEAATGSLLHTFRASEQGLTAVAASPDERTVACGGADSTVRLLDSSSGEIRQILTGHTDRINSLSFSPDGKQLVSVSADRSVKVWDSASGTDLFALVGHSAPVQGVAFSGDGKVIATASDDGTVRIWEQEARRLRHTLSVDGHWPSRVAFAPIGSLLASAGSDRIIQIWDVATGRRIYTLPGHTSEVTGLAFSPDGNTLTSTGYDRTVRIWDMRGIAP